MSLAYDAARQGRQSPPGTPAQRSRRFSRRERSVPTNTITASQARAARQREARRDQQAVSMWLRELSGGR
jgi:hypothetical protein